MEDDLIAGVATAPGSGGIAIVRVSGSGCLQEVRRRVIPRKGGEALHPQRLYFSGILDRHGKELDEGFLVWFRGPHSYTGEDMVEIHCHGGALVSSEVLKGLVELGSVRIAAPGEFTRRAFLNGKMDLVQAEAVADLIGARSSSRLKTALGELEGRLSQRLNSIRDDIIELISNVELDLDFAEEDIEIAGTEKTAGEIQRITNKLEALLGTYQWGSVAREGVRLAIVGKPNVGKSSILNALLGRDRAIVSDEPGTTRDTVEDTLDISGWLFHVVDTAGIREVSSSIEREGVRRSRMALRQADLCLVTFDSSKELDAQDEAVLEAVEEASAPGQLIFVLNKSDLGLCSNTVSRLSFEHDTVLVSAKTEAGFTTLEERLVAEVGCGRDLEAQELVAVTNTRHYELLRKCHAALRKAGQVVDSELSGEFVAVDLREASAALGEIVGTITTDDILDNIFKKFCIGK